MSQKLVLACEYMTSPLFLYEEENDKEDAVFANLGLGKRRNSGPVQIKELPLSDLLKHDLDLWDNEFQKTFDSEYPPDSGFKTAEQKKSHTERGHELANRLRLELGESFLVEYKH